MLQRLLPVVIRPYLPKTVLDPLISLSIWFQKLCCRELEKEDVIQMKTDIVIIICKLEHIFPPAFFTIMVHLLIHLPDQVLLKGPVHYNWTYPRERQLGEYKKYVRNTCYPEGCIDEQYIAHECVTYCKLYMDDTNAATTNVDPGGQANAATIIIEEVVGQKRGQYISGVGKCMKKPARPKGGYKLSAEVQAELQAKADDRVKVKELEERVKILEAMMRGSNAAGGSNASDGATSFMP
ncbi:unnamed protein product [Rhodiola kirilowii]